MRTYITAEQAVSILPDGARFIYDAIKEKIERDGMPVPPKEGKT